LCVIERLLGFRLMLEKKRKKRHMRKILNGVFDLFVLSASKKRVGLAGRTLAKNCIITEFLIFGTTASCLPWVDHFPLSTLLQDHTPILSTYLLDKVI
jgi:hypothetical protein